MSADIATIDVGGSRRQIRRGSIEMFMTGMAILALVAFLGLHRWITRR